MPILNAYTNQIGQSGQAPKIIYILTNDTLAEVSATGYLNGLVAQGIPLLDSDMALVTTKTTESSPVTSTAWLEVSHVNGDWSLIPSNAMPPLNATYITNTPNATLPNEQAMSLLGTGLVKNTTGTGIQSIAVAGTDYQQALSGLSLTAVTVAANDKVLIQDTSDSNNLKTVTAQSIADLAGGGSVTSVSGTANRITSTGGTTPVIDISASYIGQSSITSLGTISSGVWGPSATVIALASGGTGAALTANNGGIFYSTGAAGAILPGTATAGQLLQSGSTSAPSWSTATFPSTATSTGTILRANGTNWVATTATYPTTTTANQILYSSATNTISEITTAANGVLITSAGSVPSISSTLPSAVQVSVGSLNNGTSASSSTFWRGDGTWATAGGGVTSISGTANQITASASTGAVTLSLPSTVKINTSILDSNSATILAFSPTASAVNYWTILNDSTSGGPILRASGSDTHVGFAITDKDGLGYQVDNVGSAYIQANTFSIDINNNTVYWPTDPSGGNGYLLSVASPSGVLSWIAPPNPAQITDGSNTVSAEGSIGLTDASGDTMTMSSGIISIADAGTGTNSIVTNNAAGSIVLTDVAGDSIVIASGTIQMSCNSAPFNLPTAAGTAGQVLTNDGSGNLFWA